MTSSSCRSGRWPVTPSIARCAAGRRSTGCCSGWRSALSLWAKYFVAVLAIPMALFVLIDRDARKCLATPGPYIAIAVALVVMAPHLVWLVQNDFLPFGYAEHRAVLPRGLIDHVWHPLQFAISQLFFLIPSLLIAAPLFWPRARAGEAPLAAKADAFDRRIVTLLAFGPMATVLALSAVSGRGTVAMWGYPLWLFLGLWIVLTARRALDVPLGRLTLTWAIVFSGLALAFIANYDVLPRFDHRYRAVFFPGGDLGRDIVATLPRHHRKTDRLRDRQHVGRRQCRALRAEPSARADRRQAGARALDRSQRPARARRAWWCGRRAIRTSFRRSCARLPPTPRCSRRSRCPTGAGRASVTVGWAILLPRPSFAGGR